MKLVIVGVVVGLTRVAAADPSELSRLTVTARDLAQNGNCDAVKDLGRRVRSLDETYYETEFRFDPVITSCGPLPGTTEQVAVIHAGQPQRHGFTADLEIGGGFGQYIGDQGGSNLFDGSTNSESVFNVGAGVGAFVSPQVVLGIRGLAAFSRAKNLTYTPPAVSIETPGPPAYSVHTSLSNEIVVANLQAWRSGGLLWVGFGLGVGRVNLAPDSIDPSRAASGLATDTRVGLTAPYGFEASLELTSITLNGDATGPSTQVGLAFLVGWQFF